MSTATAEKPGVRVAASECLNPNEVQVGTANGPGIYAGPGGSTLPETTTAPFTAPWDCLGYLSDDGPTIGSTSDSTDLVPWQSVVPIRSVLTSRGITIQFTMWQLNELTLGMYFDVDQPTPEEDGSLDFDVRTDSPQHIRSIAIDAADADRVFRISFYRATLSAAGDLSITRGAAMGLDVTLSALDDGGRLARVQLGPAGGNPGGTFTRDVTKEQTAAMFSGAPEVSPSAAAQRGASPRRDDQAKG